MPASEPTATHAGRESGRDILAMIGERSLGVQGGKSATAGPLIRIPSTAETPTCVEAKTRNATRPRCHAFTSHLPASAETLETHNTDQLTFLVHPLLPESGA